MSGVHTPGEGNPADLEKFLQRVRPPRWKNPKPSAIYDFAIIGAGPAGLAAADAAVRLGLKVALLERNRLGGNSLNAGSIPSKAIIRTAHVYAVLREASELGATEPTPQAVDFKTVMARMRRIRTRVAEYNSVDRLQAKGIEIFFGETRFTGPDTLIVGDMPLRFKKALIATGARPRPSNIPGLEEIGYQTSATIFDLEALPKRLAIIGGGPLGCELAQAFCRLCCHVTIAQNDPKFLPREERDAAALLSQSLARDGVEIRLNTTVVGAHVENGTKFLDTIDYDVKGQIPADEILLSIGRIANVEPLALQVAGIECDAEHNIVVDDFLNTTNLNVYAAGDVCMSHKFTNVAEASARIVVRNAFQEARRKRSHLTIPWCTFCDPEIAHIGIQVWEAKSQYSDKNIYHYDAGRRPRYHGRAGRWFRENPRERGNR